MRLTASAIGITLGKRTLHEGLSFAVSSGESLAVLGPSGSGKSTLLTAIAGYLPLSGGALTTATDSAHPVRVQWLVQSSPLLPRRTVWDNALIGGLIHGRSESEMRREGESVLRDLGIWDLRATSVQQLSGGERQRVAVARTILTRADLVLADEPTASLDRAARDDVVDALRLVVRRGAALIVATHDDVVAQSCQRRLMLT